MAPSTMQIQVQCPVCSNRYVTQVRQIIDVTDDPESKRDVLSGSWNVSKCSQCDNNGMIDSPILYHDGNAELLMVYIPTSMNLSSDQNQQLIGGLTTELMDSLDADKRKGYLFNPITVLSRKSLVERILVADGVDPEILKKQEQHQHIFSELLQKSGEQRTRAIEQYDDQMDEEFFHLLLSVAAEAERDEKYNLRDEIISLRDQVLLSASWSKERGLTPSVLEAQQSKVKIISSFIDAEQDDWSRLAEEHKEDIDYHLFQILSSMSDHSGDNAKLIELRDFLVSESPQPDSVPIEDPIVNRVTEKFKQMGDISRENLLQLVVDSESDEEIEVLANLVGSHFDYQFFLLFADKIDEINNTDSDAAAKLEDRREYLLAAIERSKEQAREVLSKINRHIDQLIEGPNTTDQLVESLNTYGELLLIEIARRSNDERIKGNEEVASQMDSLSEQLSRTLYERLPDHVKLVAMLVDEDNANARDELVGSYQVDVLSASLEHVNSVLESADHMDPEMQSRLNRVREILLKKIGDRSS